MADKQIGELTSGGAATAGDKVHGVRSGNSRELTLGDAAGKSTGTGAGDVATGNHTHSDLAPKNNAAFTGTFAPPDNTIGLGKLVNASAVSLLGRSANSGGARADIAAASNDTLLRRVSDALGFGQLTVGMVPDGILTYAKLASAALAAASDFRGDVASKLLTAQAVWDAAEAAVLTEGANIAVDLSAGFNFGGSSNAALALLGNRNLSAPSNVKPGQCGVLWFTASGATRTLTPNGAWMLEDKVEASPWSITTSETLGVCYITRGTTAYINGILRF